ncbi:ABC transporter permease [Brevibacillus laterosporus]|uniref:ABC-type transport system, permease n=1 Tax=Brevibacillus laterosporus LMG 15441 TaxID=1042163 RepID=A0A075QWW5_BRELA|nr:MULTISPECIES: ABC-2 family transporter protein [Brevibacillus]HAS02072.1 ABC transporter permease [Brevibacillus sp.]AIG24892.1 ABC-type transport system, permease [Brevibacillus laterosporus LMG 15441]MBA4533313.1 ABC-2 family transporter protein [Brevibacillus halotolerans]RJL11161.1 ABC transporter permease [Brevibacillus laterosporus]TPH13752.1 ABC transporter permease [Brevibacillus laterosporus]
MLRIYGRLLRASIRSRMQYKWNFIISNVMIGLLLVVDFLGITVLLWKFTDIQGWTLYELGLIFGFASISEALFRMFASEIHEFEKYILQGEFDQVLIRPISPLVLLLSRNIDIGRLGQLGQGMLVCGYSFFQLMRHGQDITGILMWMPIIIIGGALICFSLSLIVATFSFWMGRISDLQVFLFYAPMNASKYPISLYTGWLKTLFFTLMPIAFVNYTALSYLLDKGGSWILLLVSPLVALAFLGAAISFWNFGIRHYHSTGN